MLLAQASEQLKQNLGESGAGPDQPAALLVAQANRWATKCMNYQSTCSSLLLQNIQWLLLLNSALQTFKGYLFWIPLTGTTQRWTFWKTRLPRKVNSSQSYHHHFFQIRKFTVLWLYIVLHYITLGNYSLCSPLLSFSPKEDTKPPLGDVLCSSWFTLSLWYFVTSNLKYNIFYVTQIYSHIKLKI